MLVTGGNDDIDNIKKLIDFLYSISPSIPLHFSRYFPHYKYSQPPTSLSLIETAYEMAKEKLNYVYIGNVLTEEGNSTFCPQCGNLLIKRFYYRTEVIGIKEGKCSKCGRKVDVIL